DDIFTLPCVHDDNRVVYVNGQQVIDAQGWTPNADNCVWKNCYETLTIPTSSFVAGENVLAIYLQQNRGGAYFDCDLRVKSSGGVAGDVTGDGQVDIADVNAVINMMLGKAPQTAAGDATGDGKVDIADVNAMINIMLGKN
ncbi:MAG: dockerin type I repeat-containing protein, partial [Muribaculaceae bacterium]|nr:dockerin type I repeat-containing protein [Muribaculaceae bacterium]